jgi:hypothetical protein
MADVVCQHRRGSRHALGPYHGLGMKCMWLALLMVLSHPQICKAGDLAQVVVDRDIARLLKTDHAFCMQTS